MFLMSWNSLGQFTFTNGQLNNVWGTLPPLTTTPLTFGTAVAQDGVAIIDTPEGSAVYSFDGGRSLLSIETQGDVYTSTVDNVRFTPGLKTQTLSGENLSFSSTTNPNRTDIDAFSFSGGSSEFRFELEEFHTTGGDTLWGGESLTVRRRNDLIDATATKVYVRDSDGQFIEIGEATYSERNNSLALTSVLGSHDGTDFSADQIQLMRRGDTDLGSATNLYISRGPEEFVQVGTADIAVSPDRKFLSLTSINGASQGYSFSADTFDGREINGSTSAEATGVFVRNANGDFIQIGEAEYSEANNSLEMTSVLGQYEGTEFSAGQLELMRRGDTDLGSGTNLYISQGPGEFVQVGTANIAVSPDRKFLSLTGISGETQGYNFSADTFNAQEVEDNISANATGVYVRNAAGDFVQIGEADYSEENNSLAMTSVLGQYEGTEFSAGQLELLQQGNSDIGRGTDIFISQGPGEFVQVGTADIELAPNRSTLSLTGINGESSGYNFSADTFNAEEIEGSVSANATGIFIRNANGDFIQIGEADYSEENNRLEMTSLLGHYEGTEFSADQLELMRRGNTDIGSGTNLFISQGPGEFVQIGTADLELGPQGNKLWLSNISGETNGFTLSADQVFASEAGNNQHLEIVNGEAIRESERLSFGNAVIDSDGETVSADIDNLFITNGDISYSTGSFVGSTNGESIDINTTGVLRTGGNNVDLTFNARGVNGVGLTGPAEDGGILIERNAEGRVVRAEGGAYLTTTEDGGISDIGVALGDTISFRATDADGNARELTAQFSYDEAAGKFYLKTVFKDGDQTEIQVMPFKFTSEKVGEDAIAALSVSLEQQDIRAYLNTMTGIIDLERVNDFLAVGPGRMQVRLGNQSGMEFYYANDNLTGLDSPDSLPFGDIDGNNMALGIGLFNRGPGDDVHSGGLLISADSSLRYDVEYGTLSVAGVDLPDQGQIPLTIGTYYRHEDDEGNAIFGTLGTSLADLGSVSGGVVVERVINDLASWNVGVSGNSDGDIAAMAGIKIQFGGRVNDSPRRYTDNRSYYDPREAGDMARSIYGDRYNSVLGQ